MDLQLNIQKTLEQLGDETVKICSLGQIDIGNAAGTDGKSDKKADGEPGMEGIGGILREEIGEEVLRERFLLLLRENMETDGQNHPGKSILTEPTERITFSKSEIDLKAGRILLAVTYPVQLPVGFLDIGEFTITQYSYRYGWIGDDTGTWQENGSDGQIVYITENSQVYHLSDDCTYLRLSIHTIHTSEVWEVRNADGRIYTACELCKPEMTADVFYITDYGSRYHGDINCSGLKRTFQAVSITEVGNRRPCSRCAKSSQGG